MQNTIIYSILLLFSFMATFYSKKPHIKLLLFLVTYLVLFILAEYISLFLVGNIWSQRELTSECYDWFHHYLKKDYGVVNGKLEFDLTENIYQGDFTLSNEQSLLKKYNLIFKNLNLSEGKTLLDCGCGTGTWMSFCRDRGVKTIGLTLSHEQRQVIEKKGLVAYVQDYRVLNKNFIQQFDAISVLGSTEHITEFTRFDKVDNDSYREYSNLFKILRQYLKPGGKIQLTTVVQCIPESERSLVYDRFQTYILMRHYGGYYTKVPTLRKAITENDLQIETIEDYTQDYHWTSVAEPDHFGHWCVDWTQDPLDKVLYFFKGLMTDPFLPHKWLYYAMDSWMWNIGGYQKTPLTDGQVEKCVANLKYFLISIP